jgi:hypothetical protein
MVFEILSRNDFHGLKMGLSCSEGTIYTEKIILFESTQRVFSNSWLKPIKLNLQFENRKFKNLTHVSVPIGTGKIFNSQPEMCDGRWKFDVKFRFFVSHIDSNCKKTVNWIMNDNLVLKVFIFYLPHMEYEGSFGFVSRKMKFFYCWFSRFRTFYG